MLFELMMIICFTAGEPRCTIAHGENSPYASLEKCMEASGDLISAYYRRELIPEIEGTQFRIDCKKVVRS